MPHAVLPPGAGRPSRPGAGGTGDQHRARTGPKVGCGSRGGSRRPGEPGDTSPRTASCGSPVARRPSGLGGSLVIIGVDQHEPARVLQLGRAHQAPHRGTRRSVTSSAAVVAPRPWSPARAGRRRTARRPAWTAAAPAAGEVARTTSASTVDGCPANQTVGHVPDRTSTSRAGGRGSSPRGTARPDRRSGAANCSADAGRSTSESIDATAPLPHRRPQGQPGGAGRRPPHP